ncbi:MAG: FISUMP domain-containing protein [Bacteroidota bacterium]
MFKPNLSIFKSFAITMLLVMIVIVANAQSEKKTEEKLFYQYWEINFNAGTTLFFGDVKQYKILPAENELRLGFGFQLMRQLTPIFGVRGQMLYAEVSGVRKEFDRYFQADLFEFNLNAKINFSNLISGYKKRLIDVYATIGLGFVNYNSQLIEISTDKIIREIGFGSGESFGGRSFNGIGTIGMGFDIRISDNWYINLESANRIMNTDIFDGWVGGFKYDIYNYSSVGITFKFGQSKVGKTLKTKEDETPKNVSMSAYPYILPPGADEERVIPPNIDMLEVPPIPYNPDVASGKANDFGTFVDERDGKTYRMVIIGTQVWMAQNLNFGTRIDGGKTMRDDKVITKYCYNDKESNCNVYGGLYQWGETMSYSRLPGAKGICPEGWHVPSDSDWKKLEQYLGMSVEESNETGYRGGGSFVGAKLKPQSSMWDVSDAREYPISGFNALPAGYRYAFGTFYYIDEFGFFWTSTEASDTYIWYRLLSSDDNQIRRDYYYKTIGFSVRCIQD